MIGAESRILAVEAIRNGTKAPAKPEPKYKVKNPRVSFGRKCVGWVALIFSPIVHLGSWLKKKVSPSPSVQFRRAIKKQITDGFQQAQNDYWSPETPFVKEKGCEHKAFLAEADRFAKEIYKIPKSGCLTMDEIDGLNKKFGKLCQKMLSFSKEEREKEPLLRVFNFLKACAKARLIPDCRAASLA